MKNDKRGIPFDVRYEQLKKSHDWLRELYIEVVGKSKFNRALRRWKKQNNNGK